MDVQNRVEAEIKNKVKSRKSDESQMSENIWQGRANASHLTSMD